jgi:LysM repeat protein
MRRGLSVAGLALLTAVLLLSTVSCDQGAPSREPTAQGGTTGQTGVPPQTGAPTAGPGESTARPGETVVTVFTPIPNITPGQVTPTQDLAIQTPGVTTPVATAIPGATAAPVGTPGATVIHTVQPGDTLTSIAAQYDTTVEAIQAANKITDPDDIYVGQKLIIPVQSGSIQPTPSGNCRFYHTVQKGEWVYQIARSYGVSPTAVLAANGMTSQTGSLIYPGQVLCIP